MQDRHLARKTNGWQSSSQREKTDVSETRKLLPAWELVLLVSEKTSNVWGTPRRWWRAEAPIRRGYESARSKREAQVDDRRPGSREVELTTTLSKLTSGYARRLAKEAEYQRQPGIRESSLAHAALSLTGGASSAHRHISSSVSTATANALPTSAHRPRCNPFLQHRDTLELGLLKSH